MIPLVFHDPQHVVLIGDHRQLGPVIMEGCARNFGLETSLFERYCGRAVMLTEQYRMVSTVYCIDKVAAEIEAFYFP